jgi:hypothetical protein
LPVWLEITLSSASVVGLLVVAFQIFQGNKRRQEDVRPYVHLAVSKARRDGKLIGQLRVTNSGLSPALNVTLGFPSQVRWSNVSRRDLYPFLKEGGITRLNPGETLTFFLGPLTTKSNPESLMSKSSVTVVVSYKLRENGKEVKESNLLTLSESGYLMSPS